MLDFVIPVVGDALGRSPIYDEWKGDFAAARNLADEALQSGDPTQRADALIASGLVQILQGELIAAGTTLASVSAVASDPRQTLLAFAYQHLAAMLRYRLAPGGGLLSVELETRWNAIELTGANDQRWTELVGRVGDDATTMHAAIIYHVVSLGPVQRQMLDMRHSSIKPDELDGFLSTLVQAAVQKRQIAMSKGASPAILAFLETVIADYSARAGKIDFARGVFGQAFEHYQQASDTCGMARCLAAVADTFIAPSSSPESWNMLLQESTSESSALTWRDEAREFRLDGIDEEKARGIYQTAAELLERASARRGGAAVALRRAWLNILREDFAAAVDAFTASAATAGECGDRLLEGLARAGAALGRVGVDARAEDQPTFEELGAWGKASGSVAYVAGLGRLAARVARHFALRLGDSERARACYRMSRALYGSLGLPFAESQILADLGRLHDAIGDRPAAIVYYTDALESQQRAMTAAPGLSPTLQRASNDVRLRLYQVYERNLDPDGIERVIAGFSDHIGVQEDTSGHFMQGWTAIVAQLRRPTAEDVDGFERHLSSIANRLIVSTVETARVTAASYRAVAARDEGRLTESADLFARAIEYARNATTASSDQLQAIVLAHQRRFDDAAAAYDRALVAQRKGKGFAERLVTAMQQSPEGRLEAAMQQQRIEEQAATFMTRIKEYARARGHLQAIERLSGADWWACTETPWETLELYGEVAEGLGDLEAALDRYDNAIDALERHRMLLTAQELKVAAAGQRGVRYVYFNAARAALKSGAKAAAAGQTRQAAAQGARAFRYMELGRARNLLDLMSTGRDDSAAMLTARRIRARIAAWNSVLSQMADDSEADAGDQQEYRRRLRVDTDALRAVEVQLLSASKEDTVGAILDLERVRELIDGETCLIEYAYAGEDLLILAIRRDHALVTELVPSLAAALDAKATTLLDAIHTCRSVDSVARDLAAILLEPIASVLGQCRRIIVVPDGALHRVPFHLLPLAGAPLMRTALVSYLPSASALRLVAGASRAPGSILAVGNPANMSYQGAAGMPRESLAPVPGAAIEATAVSRYFDDPLLLTAEAATKTAIVSSMGRYRHLHFATHGYLNATTPQFSGLAFANGTTLNVFELSGMRLDADLVVLSACDSGGGAITGGNDIIGLAHALLAAGARALIVSLWPVNDWSAAIIMNHLYTGLSAGRPAVEALTAAQEALRLMTQEQWNREFSALAAQTGDEGATFPSTTRSHFADTAPPCPPSEPRHSAAFILIGCAPQKTQAASGSKR